MRNDDYSKPIYSTDEIHCAVSEFHQPYMSEAEPNEHLLYHVSVESDMHIPTKPLKNKIIFYKGVLREPHEITLIPTIKIDYNLPELHSYRAKNLTISLIWLCFCVYIGWRQTYPKWK